MGVFVLIKKKAHCHVCGCGCARAWCLTLSIVLIDVGSKCELGIFNHANFSYKLPWPQADYPGCVVMAVGSFLLPQAH